MIKQRISWRYLAWLALALGLIAPAILLAQDTNRAAVVVRLADGQVESRCVPFDEPQISGYEALTRAGFEVESQAIGMGNLVCRIDGEGCAADDCLCQCKGGPDCVYWSYWHQVDGLWQYATVGAASYQLTDGSLDGWSWGPGSVVNAVEPPPQSFEEVCAFDSEGQPAATQATPPADTTETAQNNWLPYLAFGLILLVMVGAIMIRRPRVSG